MDFIPASLLNDVSKLKTGKPKKDAKTAKPRASVRQPSPDCVLDELPKQEPNDVRKILTPAHPKKSFKEIITTVTPDVESREREYQEDPQLKVLTTRKEIVHLRDTMRKMLDSIGIDENYPTEMHAFVNIIKEEQKIYSNVFQEIIRQVTVNMVERGELLSEIRNRYSKMFIKIPEHVMNLHTELVAHRKLNRRLSEELMRAKEHISELCKEIEYVREHDEVVNGQAREAQEKLLQMMNNQDSNEESMEEFHKLYKLQRSRLEHQVGIAEKEKRLWINAATSLATRISKEYGINDLLLLQKHEEGRLRITNHMVVNISDANANDLHAVEVKIDEWRTKLTQISKSIVGEDYSNIELLGKVQRQMRKVLKNLITNEPQNDIELGHQLLTEFHIFDVQSLAEHLQFWTVELTEITRRFTSGRDQEIKDEIATSRRMTNLWVELALRLLRRNQDSTNGEEYLPLTKALKSLQGDIFDWCNKLETRASGEDGITNLIIMIQTQIEDRSASLTARGTNKPLTTEDRQEMIQNLNYLIEQTGLLINTLSNTAEREQHKIPLQVENWIARVLEQMNNDIDSRNEDNISVHTNLVSWMVNLLLPSRNVKESKEEQFESLSEQLAKFNSTLLRDAADMEMITDDKRDMRKLLQELCANWINLCNRLLKMELSVPKQPIVEEPKVVKPAKPALKIDLLAPKKVPLDVPRSPKTPEPKTGLKFELKPSPMRPEKNVVARDSFKREPTSSSKESPRDSPRDSIKREVAKEKNSPKASITKLESSSSDSLPSTP